MRRLRSINLPAALSVAVLVTGIVAVKTGEPRTARLPASRVFNTTSARIQVVTITAELTHPWSLAFLPDGDMLVSERAGGLRLIRDGVLHPQPISIVPALSTQDRGDLLDIAVHPQFFSNQLIYLTYLKLTESGSAGVPALARGRLDGFRLVDTQEIFVAVVSNEVDVGARLAFGRDHALYMSVGDREDNGDAQNLAVHSGKVLRLRDDGTAAADNPFTNQPGNLPEIYSYGHRQPQGLAVHWLTGELWEHEEGPAGGDELNIIQRGRNYGWPVITMDAERDAMERSLRYWAPPIEPSGLAIYSGNQFPKWANNIFIGSLAGRYIRRIVVGETGVFGEERLLTQLGRRIRDVRVGPDGFLYALTDGSPAELLRIEPAEE